VSLVTVLSPTDNRPRKKTGAVGARHPPLPRPRTKRRQIAIQYNAVPLLKEARGRKKPLPICIPNTLRSSGHRLSEIARAWYTFYSRKRSSNCFAPTRAHPLRTKVVFGLSNHETARMVTGISRPHTHACASCELVPILPCPAPGASWFRLGPWRNRERNSMSIGRHTAHWSCFQKQQATMTH